MEENLNNAEDMQNTPQTPEVTPCPPAQDPQPPAYPPYQQPYQQVPCQKPERLRRNHLGGTGFVLGVIGIVLFWVPFVRFILGVLGLTFSLVAIFRKNCRKAFPIVGLILSSLVLFIIALIWFHFGYTLTDIFDEDFIDFLNFLDK